MANCFDNRSQFSSNELATRAGDSAFKLHLGTCLDQALIQLDPRSGVISRWGCTSKDPPNAGTCSKTLRWVGWTSVSRTPPECPESHHSVHLVVTTFELARDDIERLCDQHWSCIIVDEVHRVKNPKSRTSKTLNMFQCPVRLGLTGTPAADSPVCVHRMLMEGKFCRHCHPE